MKLFHRVTLAALTSCLLALAAVPAAQASFGITEPNFEAGTCEASSCTYSSIKSTPSEAFTQAAGHPAWGITAFTLNSTGFGHSELLRRIRVDIPPGLAADPQASTLKTCERSVFEEDPKKCPSDSEAGKVEMEAETELLVPVTLPELSGTVYNLALEPGLPLQFGIAVEPAEPLIASVKLLLKGHVSDQYEPVLAARGVASDDYHEFFEIDEVPTEGEVLGGIKAPLKVLKSKLLFNGHAGGNFLTLPSACSPSTTSYLEVESYGAERSSTPTHTPVGVDGCGKAVPFKPTAEVEPQDSQYDSPDGVTTEVKVPQQEGSSEINTADIADADVTLPEGLTLNPSAAKGLEACTPAELDKSSAAKPTCPAGSIIGSDTLETDLPAGSLTGNVYLGLAEGQSLPITEPPFGIYLVAESIYGVTVKLAGTVQANRSTGRLEVSFANNPQLPFSDLKLTLHGGNQAPLANPDSCAAGSTESLFTAYVGDGAAKSFSPASPFAVSGCPATIPFSLSQATGETSTKAAGFTSFTFNLTRDDEQQNLSTLQTELPAGLVGLIPSVTLCEEPAAAAGNCPSTSQIGSATASAGSGAEPYGFAGPVYLTGPTGSAPYGLSIPIEAAAGPFDLGRVTTRVALSVDPHSGRVIASATLPTIQRGVPLRLRSLTVAVTKSSFLFNPTNCSGLATESTVSSIGGAVDKLSSPLVASDCSSLSFKPAFAASSPSAPSRANGASLIVSYTEPAHEANIRSVVAQLPSQLPSRLTTLHKACAEATFDANPEACPKESKVGTATVTTPVLPGKLTGPAYLVSHGGASFPNLELILQGDHGVKVLLESTTQIKNGITTSTFASVPDVPVSSFELSLPIGPYSALGSYGSLCAKPLYLPTTVTAQNGAVSKQNVRISIGSCKIKLLSHRISGHHLIVKVETFTAGRVSVWSAGLHTTYRHLGGPAITTIKVPLSKRGKRTLAEGRSLRIKVRVGFNPAHGDEYHSAAYTTVTFKH